MTNRRVVLALMVLASCGGGGPKIALRYHPPAGAVYHYALDQRTQLNIQSGPLAGMGRQAFITRLHFTHTVKGPATGGGTEVQVVFDSISLEIPGMSAEAIAGELAKMRGLRSRVVLDERAQILRSDFEQPPGVMPQIAKQVEAAIATMTFAFPEQPVGRGDSWMASVELLLGQLPGTNASEAGPARTTVAVQEIHVEGPDTSVIFAIETRFPSGPIRLTYGGIEGTLRMSGELTGTQRYSLTRSTIIEAASHGTMKMNVTAPTLGSQVMEMSSEMENTLHLLGAK
jgi:hypothetical protein